MIHYTKNEAADGRAPYYSCFYGPNEMAFIGTIDQEVDGFYYFFPRPYNGGFWDADTLKDIGRKLDALNEAWKQHLEIKLAPSTKRTHPYGEWGDVL